MTDTRLSTMAPLLRQAILDSRPPYEPPYTYMNFGQPLTPLQFEPRLKGRGPDRRETLRHALWMLDELERKQERLDFTQTDTALGIVMGIMYSAGIDMPESQVEVVPSGDSRPHLHVVPV